MVLKSTQKALVSVFLTIPFLQGFVLLSGPEKAHLPVTPDAPTITFHLNPKGPPLDKKEEFLGGVYKDLSDEELYPILVQEAMNRWNSIDGSYVRLAFETDDNAILEEKDNIFSIVQGNLEATAAAAADPVVENRLINDCDIKISNRKVNTKSLAYTLMHELGHCLGLGHNHTSYNAVMGYSRASTSLYLSADDKAGILFLYGDPNAAKPKEMISCGSIRGESRPRSMPIWLFVSLPLAVALWPRLRRSATSTTNR